MHIVSTTTIAGYPCTPNPLNPDPSTLGLGPGGLFIHGPLLAALQEVMLKEASAKLDSEGQGI